jgi:hypothetical protein
LMKLTRGRYYQGGGIIPLVRTASIGGVHVSGVVIMSFFFHWTTTTHSHSLSRSSTSKTTEIFPSWKGIA